MAIESQPQQNRQLPSISGYFSDPKSLKKIVIISFLINIVLLCSFFVTPGESNTPITTPTPAPTTASKTTIPTLKPTQTETEAEADVRKCFESCTPQEFLTKAEAETKKVSAAKANISYIDVRNSKCYAEYIEMNHPDKEFKTSYLPKECVTSYTYSPKPVTYQLSTDVYFYNSSISTWEKATASAKTRLRMLDIIAELQKQQNLKLSDIDAHGMRSINAESNIVNEFNQVVKFTAHGKFNAKLELISFAIAEEKAYTTSGVFYEFNIANTIENPVTN